MARMTTVRKGNNVIVCGVVSKIREGQDGRVVNVTLEGETYDSKQKASVNKKLEFAFWNSDKSDDLLEGKNQLADRVRKAKVSEGAYLMVKGYVKDGKCVGLDFRYTGRLSLAPEKDKEGDKGINVMVGSVSSVRMNEEKGVANVNIPFDDSRYDESGNKVGFGLVNHQIAFWDNENKKPTSSVVEYLTPKEGEDGKKVCAKVVIVASEVKGNRTFGEDGYGANYTGFQWSFAPSKKKSSDSTPAQEFPEDEDDGFMNIPDDIEEGLPFN